MAQHILMNNAVQQRRWHVFSDNTSLIAALTQEICAQANSCIKAQGRFSIVLAGGETPRALYQQLRNCQTDWQHWHIYFGDERCMPVDDPSRNDNMTQHVWLMHVAIPVAQIHRIPAQLSPAEAVAQYTQTLSSVAQFDLVLLGLGEDSHTASLFPLQEWGEQDDAPAVLAVQCAPKPPAQRTTLSAHRLSQAQRVFFIVSGENKRAALQAWRNNAAIPAAAILPTHGVDIYTDVVIALV